MSRPVVKSAAQIAAEKAANPSGRRAPPKRTHYRVGNCLKDLREKQGLSRADVENGSGVGSQTVASAESGGDVTISRAMRLAAFYERKIEDIWDGSEEPIAEAAAAAAS
jgi:DNA-binding XRE family transcriptional regulator